jgi:hypothetical protein
VRAGRASQRRAGGQLGGPCRRARYRRRRLVRLIDARGVVWCVSVSEMGLRHVSARSPLVIGAAFSSVQSAAGALRIDQQHTYFPSYMRDPASQPASSSGHPRQASASPCPSIVSARRYATRHGAAQKTVLSYRRRGMANACFDLRNSSPPVPLPWN